MKTFLTFLGLSLGLTASQCLIQAADQPGLSEHLSSARWQLGDWEGSGSTDSGGTFKLKMTITSELEGDLLHNRWQVMDDQDNVFLSGQGWVFWRPELKSLGGFGIDSMGGHGESTVVKQSDNQWISQSQDFDKDGQFGTGLSETAKVDDNTLNLVLSRQLRAGEPQPDIKATLKRVQSAPEQELIKAENQWNDALVHVDIEALDKLIATEYAETGDKGQRSTKAEHLSSVKSGDFKVTSAVLDDLKVHVYGNAAVVTGRNTTKEQEKGKDTSGVYRFTDTWAKRDGRWQCVASHWSIIEEKKP
jgi:ketosteroid isomerase-like protein